MISSVQDLCDALARVTGLEVTVSSLIAELSMSSLELLHLVLSLRDPELVDAFPYFFEDLATPATVWTAAHGS